MKTRTLALAASILVLAIIIGCTVPQKITKPDGTPGTNYIVDPRLTTGLATAGAVNAATAPVNPYSPIVEIVLGGATLIASWFAKRKNDETADANLLTKTIIQGVENAGHPETKKAIQIQATAIGVEGKLGTLVQAVNSGVV